ncbi:hypothetical protein FZO89_09740 [Luteimonas viscosa]|uniref:Uncharacterized protein n=1 Tax=Luteimonas viscosa TaxID=1132694 RepID=A0A5D4XPB2_9GAMM|nr:hypothetical protein [Luteimonas viscosa]TYT26517.1 hypothetical protein FZO89_09740 [Luteimonas viscosa]
MYRIAAPSLLFVLAACSAPSPDKLADRAAEQAAAAAVDAASDGRVRFDPAEGTLQVEDDDTRMQSGGPAGMARPDWWPADVDLPQAHVIRQVVRSGSDQLLVVTVPQAGSAIHGQIEQGMHGHGWTTASASQAADGAGMAMFHKPGREATVMVMPARRAGDATTLTYRLRQAGTR